MSKSHLTQEIEQDSIAQLVNAIRHHTAWKPQPISPDNGEDLWVRIFDKIGGEFVDSNMRFEVQVKGAQDATRSYGLKNGDFSYSLSVAHILKWNDALSPVFLILWDLKTEQGFWIEIRDFIENELQERNPDWKLTQTHVKVRIPEKNRIDDDGLKRIRATVASRYLPLFMGNPNSSPFRLELEFDSSEEGRQSQRDVLQHIASGSSAKISGRFVARADVPSWWKRYEGKETPDWDRTTLNFPNKRLENTIPLKLEFLCKGQIIYRIDYLEFTNLQTGDVEAIWESKTEAGLIATMHAMKNAELALNLKFSFTGQTVAHAKRILDTFKQLNKNGGLIRLTLLRDSKTVELDHPENLLTPPLENLSEILDELSFIESQTGAEFTIPVDEILEEEVFWIRRTAALLRERRLLLPPGKAQLQITRPGLQNLLNNIVESAAGQLVVVLPEAAISLLGETVNLRGSLHRTFEAKLSQPVDMLQKTLTELGPDEVTEITFEYEKGEEVLE